MSRRAKQLDEVEHRFRIGRKMKVLKDDATSHGMKVLKDDATSHGSQLVWVDMFL